MGTRAQQEWQSHSWKFHPTAKTNQAKSTIDRLLACLASISDWALNAACPGILILC